MSGGRARALLVVSQLALACALLTGASFVVRSVRAAFDQHWGFDTRPLVTFRFDLPKERYPGPSRVLAFHDRLLAGLRALPGAAAAGAVEPLPVLGGERTAPIDLPGREAARPQDRPWSVVFRASEGALEALGIPLLRGRSLEPRDAEADVALVTRAFAERYFAGLDPLGRSVSVNADGGGLPRRVVVVGVTGDLRPANPTEPPKPTLFLPMDRGASLQASVVVRASGDPRALLPLVRGEIRRADPDLAVLQLATLDQLRLEDQSSDEVISGMFGAFALVALLMASMGLYASMAYLVSQRTQEIGIRMALGARGAGVLAMILAQGARLGLLGAAIGLGLGFALARAAKSLLYGVTLTDPLTYAGIAALLLAVALLASVVPAWRATRVDPIRTLRAE